MLLAGAIGDPVAQHPRRQALELRFALEDATTLGRGESPQLTGRENAPLDAEQVDDGFGQHEDLLDRLHPER